MVNNGNRTEWSPIRSVIIQVINKIVNHELLLLPINQNYDKIRETNKPLIERWTIKRHYECWKTQQFTQQSAPQQCS